MPDWMFGASIGAMPFLWLSVPDRADRGYVERNSIALTSCLAEGLDQPSAGWLGRDAVRTEISQSGLWNVDHAERPHRRAHAPSGRAARDARGAHAAGADARAEPLHAALSGARGIESVKQ